MYIQMSKCGQNIRETHNDLCITFLFSPHFDIICGLHTCVTELTINIFFSAVILV